MLSGCARTRFPPNLCGVHLPAPLPPPSRIMSDSSDTNKILLVILCVLGFGPLAVYLKNNRVDNEFWLNLVLWVLTCGLGSMIHGIIVALRED